MPESSPNTARSPGAQAADDATLADREVRRSLAGQARQHADEQARLAKRIREREREHYRRYWSPYAQQYADVLDDCATRLRSFAESLLAPDSPSCVCSRYNWDRAAGWRCVACGRIRVFADHDAAEDDDE